MAECEYIEACRMAYGEEGCEPACDLDLPCYLYKPKVDRDALLALADEMTVEKGDIWRWSRRIREALGASE